MVDLAPWTKAMSGYDGWSFRLGEACPRLGTKTAQKVKIQAAASDKEDMIVRFSTARMHITVGMPGPRS